MPAFNFQARFAPLVLSGFKKSTIRGREVKVGDPLYLYTGMRTKSCHRLGVAHVTSCLPIRLGYFNGSPYVSLRGKKLTAALVQELAEADGFADGREMVSFFEALYGPRRCAADDVDEVFQGFLITWGDLHG